MAFVNLHVHSEYSLLDGACRIEPMLDKIQSMGQTAVALTDHGVMYGSIEFFKAAKARNIKPIIGCEVYVAPRSLTDKVHGVDSERFHLILLCKNETGYKNLIKLVSESWINGFYTKPRIDFNLLTKYHDGLICLSGCLSGEISKLLLKDEYENAKSTALRYYELFGEGNYYIEIQNHNLDEQLRINPYLIRLSNETGIPLAATNDAHYIDKEDSIVQKVLLCIQTNHLLGENTGIDFATDEFYLKSEEEMLKLFPSCPEAVYNTAEIAEKCNFEFEFGKIKLPHFDVPENYSHVEWFNNMCRRGLKERYGDNPPEEYSERMEYELNIINSMGYTDYYLIVQDFINFAKKHGIPVGPGRGSGAASICAYCIGITGIDPMKYNLLFERFLNPDRISMPDFDIDFCYERRNEVIDYVIRKYGADHVSQIITFGTLQAKAAVRDVGRVLGIPYGKVDSIAKLIPDDLNITISSALEESQELKNVYASDPEVTRLIDLSKKIEGMPRHASTHAAGVVITANPVDTYVPLAVNDNVPVTQFTMKGIEQLGLLKMDFLGLRTLTVIDSAVKKIRADNPSFDINTISISDSRTFSLFSLGNTNGVFQFESAGMKRVLVQLQPESIEDIIAIIALYRPGPMNSIPDYIKNKSHPESIKYIIPELKPVLNVTYGCIVYQEQVMQICQSVAGYSYGHADIVRRAMAKKQHSVMIQERESFVSGAVERGISREAADSLFDSMLSFASYAFNKAHAAAYAHLSYQTAFLKAHYPKEFLSSLMTSFSENTAKISDYISECHKLGIKVFPPHVNTSFPEFSSDKSGIIFSLTSVKNIGYGFVNAIVSERERNRKFTSFYDFCSRLYGKDLNRRNLDSLIKCGALDNLGANRRQMVQATETVLNHLDNTYKNRMSGQIGFFDVISPDSSSEPDFIIPNVTEFSEEDKIRFEKELTGVYLSGHPLDSYLDFCSSFKLDNISDVLNDNIAYQDKCKITLLVIVNSIKKKYTRKNDLMAFIDIEDKSAESEAIAFPSAFNDFGYLLSEGTPVIIHGSVSRSEESVSFIIDSLEPVPTSVSEKHKEKKKAAHGLFLRIDSDQSPQIPVIRNLISVFDEGSVPVFFYYKNNKKYISSGKCSISDSLLSELRNILGSDNVVYNPD